MADNEFKNELTVRIVNFLIELGLEVKAAVIREETFLPGISVNCGVILIDESKLKYPGDLLHEAGHLAVVPASRRNQLQSYIGRRGGEELMAIAWSYAALVHLGLEPSVVFHEEGYRGGSLSLIENFTQGRYFAVPTLQWIGLTADDKRAKEMGIAPYPNMIKWLHD
ncbi:MAG: hypothetical protein AUG51_13790 [Acidobacteria bacterium 13_1_20CM_3_53_8]|nr:MAG: hypothetical protein AUG51_13790 [Acidobacteria bacterium 13_1_20CM_3_53_8]